MLYTFERALSMEKIMGFRIFFLKDYIVNNMHTYMVIFIK